MSSTSTAGSARPPATPDPSIAAVPFSRLVRVEMRKVYDTRAGFWLLVAIAVLTAAIITIFLFAQDNLADLTHRSFFFVTSTPQGFLLPVLAILAVTAEWSQRTGLVTFTLEPSRMRVMSAKLVGLCLYGLLAVLLALGLGALGNVLGMGVRDGAGDWDITSGFLVDMTFLQVSGLVQGFAFGLVFMNTAAAIVVYFILPTVWSILFGLVGWLSDIAPWVDLGTATEPIFDGELQAEDWAHVAVASAIWVGLPLVLGLWRLTHSEVKSA